MEPIQIDDRDEAERDDEELETAKSLIFQDISIKTEVKINNVQIDAIKHYTNTYLIRWPGQVVQK